MNGRNDRHACRSFDVQRAQLLRRARQEQAIREALRRAPQTTAGHCAALLNLLTGLFH